jgi:hypothetical protein
MHHTEKHQKQKKPVTLSHTPPSIPAEAIPLTPLSSTYRNLSTQPKLSLATAQPRHLHDDLSAVTSTSKQTSQLPLSHWAEVTTLSSPASTFKVPTTSTIPPSTKTCRLSHPKSQPLMSMHAASRFLRVPVTRPQNGSSYRALLLCVSTPKLLSPRNAIQYSPSAHGGATCMLKRATFLFHPSAPQDRHRQMMHHTTIDRPKPLES